MEKDEFFIKRIRELANLSYQRDIVTFSDFLNLNEQNIINDRKNLTRVRHTTMKLSMVDNPEHIPEPEFQEINGTCASVRLDALIGLAFQTSRNSMVPFIEGGQVFVNGKLITSNGYEPKDGDIISVRGKGRFRYEGVSRQTKKGRNSVKLLRYQ